MFGTAWVLIKEPVEVYVGYLVILALFPVYMIRYGFQPKFWYFLLFFLFTGFFNILLGNNTMDQFMKIWIGLIISYTFYHYVFERFDFDVELLFSAYMKGAVIVSIIGLVQLISFIVGFRYGYDFTWTGVFNKWGVTVGGNLGLRVNSIFGEPSTFAAVLAPAMFVALNNVVTNTTYLVKRWQSILILVVYVLTFSSLGYIGVFIALMLLMINYGFGRFILLFVPLLAIAFAVLYNNVEDFRYRWDSTIYLFETGEIDIRTEHGSSIVFYNNFVVAMENFKTNFLFGTGLGSHPVAFEQHSITKHIETFGFANNSSDANSMLLRIISEIGMVGLIIAFLFIRRNYVRRNAGQTGNNYWILSSAALCVILVYMLRQGHYFLNGFPFFVWVYYYAKKNSDAWTPEPDGDAEEHEDETEAEASVESTEQSSATKTI